MRTRAGRGRIAALPTATAPEPDAAPVREPEVQPAAVLRPWRIGDAASLRVAFIDSGDLAAQFGALELTTVLRCERFITDNLAAATVSRQNFAISIDGVAVGNVGIGSMEHRHGTGWVYYWVAAAARRQGLATLALATIADWAFAEQGLHRLELGHRTNNPVSCRVATRAGFVREGIERQKLKYGTERFDVETHARLRTDVPPEIGPLATITS
jgi:ribosomal-protein-alanine N-acetyltransferase